MTEFKKRFFEKGNRKPEPAELSEPASQESPEQTAVAGPAPEVNAVAPPMWLMPEDTLNKVLAYLGSKTYTEVAALIYDIHLTSKKV